MKAIAETQTIGWTGWKNAAAKSGRLAAKMASSGLEDAPINAWQFAYDAAHAAFNYQPALRDGVAAFFGTWPGDETDDELHAALMDLRNRPHWRCWKCATKLFVDVNSDLIDPVCKCGTAGHWFAVKVPA